MNIANLNTLSSVEFVSTLSEIFEHSPWVAQRVEHLRPFSSLDQLLRSMVEAVEKASTQEKLTLLRAHPELAGKLAQQGDLTAASNQEQARAGLKSLSSEEMGRITALNAAYLQRHQFPFIVCVGNHTKQSLLEEFDRRVGNDTRFEFTEALGQVAAIANLRLAALLTE